jgi:hypothetical protein
VHRWCGEEVEAALEGEDEVVPAPFVEDPHGTLPLLGQARTPVTPGV